MNEYQIDIIAETLRELKQEKKRLENHLENGQAQKKDSEAKLNLVNARFHHVTERHSKISANRDIEKRKVKESQDIVDRLQELHAEKQAMILQIEREIEEENKKRDEKLIYIIENLGDLAKNFYNAQNYFKHRNLEKEIIDWQEKAKEASNKAQEKRNLIQELEVQFSDISLSDEEEKSAAESSWLEIKELQNTLELFQEEERAAFECANAYRQEISSIQGCWF